VAFLDRADERLLADGLDVVVRVIVPEVQVSFVSISPRNRKTSLALS
jgi:hypothetical protein